MTKKLCRILKGLVDVAQLESGGTEGFWKVLQGIPPKKSNTFCSSILK